MRIPDEKQRLTEGVKSALIQAIAQRAMPKKMQNGVDRSTDQAGVLSVVHAQRATEAITKMDDKQLLILSHALRYFPDKRVPEFITTAGSPRRFIHVCLVLFQN
jgi:hypothetical protein